MLKFSCISYKHKLINNYYNNAIIFLFKYKPIRFK